MNEEEIRHFKSLLRQGSLRHMNILLDDKFQKELLNIIKDYEKLQQENKQLQQELNKYKSVIDEVREYTNNKLFDDYTYYSYEDLKQNIEEILDKANIKE